VAPLDPGRHWLAAGITGLARQREWDAVATTEGPGEPGDEVAYIVLPGGRLLVESAPPGLDPGFLAAAFGDQLDPPYRAIAVRRPARPRGSSPIPAATISRSPGTARR
jgi:hypothetical protein